VLGLLWDPRLDAIEVRRMVFASWAFTARGVAAAYLREHLAQLLERLPYRGDARTATLAYAFLGGCDAATRDDAVAFVKQTFSAYVGAERILAEGVEYLDICIARRKLLAPRLEAWLTRR
jgi:alanyl aminopeptidase